MRADAIVSNDALPSLENVGHATVAERLFKRIDLYASVIGFETRFGGGMEAILLGKPSRTTLR